MRRPARPLPRRYGRAPWRPRLNAAGDGGSACRAAIAARRHRFDGPRRARGPGRRALCRRLRFARGYVGGKLRTDPATQRSRRAAAAASVPWPIWAAAVVSSGLPCHGRPGGAAAPASTATRPRSVMRYGPQPGCRPDSPSPISPRRRFPPATPPCSSMSCTSCPRHAAAPARTRGHGGPRAAVLIRAFDPAAAGAPGSASPWNWAGRAVRRDRADVDPLPLQATRGTLRARPASAFRSPPGPRSPPNVLLVAERASP